jgi:hypothetical protein
MKRIAFKSNPARLGYGELFRVSGSPVTGFFACTLKLFRVLGPDTGGFGFRALGDRLDRRDPDALPRRAVRACDGYRNKLRKLGFVPGFAYSLEAFGSQEGHAMVFRHKDATAAAAVVYARCVRGDLETETTVFGFNTPLDDDTYLMTSGNKRLLCKPEHFRIEFHPGQSPRDVFDRHLDRLDSIDARPRKVRTDDDLEALVLDCENSEAEFNLDRGVFVRMTRSEVEEGEALRDEYESEADGVGSRRRRREEEDYD